MTATSEFVLMLKDPAHWAFELFVTLVFDGLVLGVLWRWLRTHWQHHVDRDQQAVTDIQGSRSGRFITWTCAVCGGVNGHDDDCAVKPKDPVKFCIGCFDFMSRRDSFWHCVACGRIEDAE